MNGQKSGDIKSRWTREWPRALAAWSSYTQLRTPEFIDDRRLAQSENMSGEIAAIRLQDQRVMVNFETIRANGLQDFALPIMAHEIGHHVYVPANLTDNGRMIAAISRMLTGLPQSSAGLVSNLYSDLLINDRLQRKAGVDIAGVYRKLAERKGPVTEVWKLYMRTYEHLWSLPVGTLQRERTSADLDADAMLLARLIRNFAGEWLRGARRFAAIVYPYLAKDEADKKQQTVVLRGLHDTKGAALPVNGRDASDAIPDGLTGIDPSEIEDIEDFDDDILDPLGEREVGAKPANDQAPSKEGTGTPGRQYRQPFEYGEILKALGLKLSEREITIRYYRERALPYLIPFPTRRAPQVTEPVAEGYREWGIGDAIEDLDAMGSVLQSPVVVPGVT
ncbi:MAG TPA: VWA domain-containing protein, partial [Blastocatellia bacterium]|nr:VWA domain-containing protein [Blastocatellia bacterium]